MLPQPSPYRDPSVLTSHSNSPHTSIECRLPSVLFTTSLKHTQRINKGTSEGNDKMTLCQEVYIATDTQHLFQSDQNNYLNIFSLKIEHNHSKFVIDHFIVLQNLVNGFVCHNIIAFNGCSMFFTSQPLFSMFFYVFFYNSTILFLYVFLCSNHGMVTTHRWVWLQIIHCNDYWSYAVLHLMIKFKSSIVIFVHSTNARFPQTPLPEVNHRAPTCVLQLYERQATKFPGMEKQGYSRLLAWGRKGEKLMERFCEIRLLFNSFLFHRICSGSCEREKSSMEMRYYRKRKHFCFPPNAMVNNLGKVQKVNKWNIHVGPIRQVEHSFYTPGQYKQILKQIHVEDWIVFSLTINLII